MGGSRERAGGNGNSARADDSSMIVLISHENYENAVMFDSTKDSCSSRTNDKDSVMKTKTRTRTTTCLYNIVSMTNSNLKSNYLVEQHA